MRRARHRFAWLLLPTWMVLGVFFLAPLLIMLRISFSAKDAAGPREGWWSFIAGPVTLENYRETVAPVEVRVDPPGWQRIYLRVFWRSLWIAGGTTIICLLVSYPVAYYIAMIAGRRWRSLLLAMVVIPFWTSFPIRMGAWRLILGAEGVLNTLLGAVGIGPLEILYTPLAVMIGLVYGELPYMILPLYVSLEKMDRSLLEAAGDLGAGPVGRFARIVMPQTMPGIIAGIVLVFIPSVGQFIVSDMLGGSNTALIGNIIEEGFVRNRPFKSALAFELTAIVLLMLSMYAIYARKRKEELF